MSHDLNQGEVILPALSALVQLKRDSRSASGGGMAAIIDNVLSGSS